WATLQPSPAKEVGQLSEEQHPLATVQRNQVTNPFPGKRFPQKSLILRGQLGYTRRYLWPDGGFVVHDILEGNQAGRNRQFQKEKLARGESVTKVKKNSRPASCP